MHKCKYARKDVNNIILSNEKCCQQPYPCDVVNPVDGGIDRTQTCCSERNKCDVGEGNCQTDNDCWGSLGRFIYFTC